MGIFSVLTVCTGNVCRSPYVEQLLDAGTSAWPEVSVSSAGTGALVGEPMTEQAQRLSRRHPAHRPERHVARQLHPDEVRSADLVLPLSREHRRAVVELVPRVARRTFTLREFARLSATLTDEDLADTASLDPVDRVGRLADLVEVVASRRGSIEPPASPADDDVIDPYLRSDEVYQESADQLMPAVATILSAFARAVNAKRS